MWRMSQGIFADFTMPLCSYESFFMKIKTFKRRRLLLYHIRSVHTGERPYSCQLCNATFVYPEHFKKHFLTHSGIKPWPCEICGKTFSSKDNRNSHRFTHSNRKPYECQVWKAFIGKDIVFIVSKQYISMFSRFRCAAWVSWGSPPYCNTWWKRSTANQKSPELLSRSCMYYASSYIWETD